MLIHIQVRVVHADDTCNVVLTAALRSRIFAELGPSEHAGRCGMVVLVSVWINAQAFWHEPTGAVGLLPPYDEQLECDEKNDEHGPDWVGLLIQKVIRVNLDVQWHVELQG